MFGSGISRTLSTERPIVTIGSVNSKSLVPRSKVISRTGVATLPVSVALTDASRMGSSPRRYSGS